MAWLLRGTDGPPTSWPWLWKSRVILAHKLLGQGPHRPAVPHPSTPHGLFAAPGALSAFPTLFCLPGRAAHKPLLLPEPALHPLYIQAWLPCQPSSPAPCRRDACFSSSVCTGNLLSLTPPTPLAAKVHPFHLPNDFVCLPSPGPPWCSLSACMWHVTRSGPDAIVR